MTRGGTTFNRKPETAHLNSDTKQASAYEGCADPSPRRQLLQPELGRVDGWRKGQKGGGGRATRLMMDERLHQFGWLFRGSHSGGGGQATGRAARPEGLWGEGGGEGGLLGPRCI